MAQQRPLLPPISTLQTAAHWVHPATFTHGRRSDSGESWYPGLPVDSQTPPSASISPHVSASPGYDRDTQAQLASMSGGYAYIAAGLQPGSPPNKPDGRIVSSLQQQQALQRARLPQQVFVGGRWIEIARDNLGSAIGSPSLPGDLAGSPNPSSPIMSPTLVDRRQSAGGWSPSMLSGAFADVRPPSSYPPAETMPCMFHVNMKNKSYSTQNQKILKPLVRALDDSVFWERYGRLRAAQDNLTKKDIIDTAKNIPLLQLLPPGCCCLSAEQKKTIVRNAELKIPLLTSIKQRQQGTDGARQLSGVPSEAGQSPGRTYTTSDSEDNESNHSPSSSCSSSSASLDSSSTATLMTYQPMRSSSLEAAGPFDFTSAALVPTETTNGFLHLFAQADALKGSSPRQLRPTKRHVPEVSEDDEDEDRGEARDNKRQRNLSSAV